MMCSLSPPSSSRRTARNGKLSSAEPGRAAIRTLLRLDQAHRAAIHGHERQAEDTERRPVAVPRLVLGDGLDGGTPRRRGRGRLAIRQRRLCQGLGRTAQHLCVCAPAPLGAHLQAQDCDSPVAALGCEPGSRLRPARGPGGGGDQGQGLSSERSHMRRQNVSRHWCGPQHTRRSTCTSCGFKSSQRMLPRLTQPASRARRSTCTKRP